MSLTGVLVILLHGDLTALTGIAFNKGDIIFTVALVIFGLYSVLTLKRPKIHGLSFVGFTFGCGAACLVPLLILELFSRPVMQLNTANLLSMFYVAVFPSTVAYLCFNRGVQLIGANRAAPFFHRRAGVRIRDGDRLPRGAPATVPCHRLCAGADRRFRCVTQDIRAIRLNRIRRRPSDLQRTVVTADR